MASSSKKRKAPRKKATRKGAGRPGTRKRATAPKKVAPPGGPAGRSSASPAKCICVNAECKLRKAGCWGYEACPGFKGRSG